jgi:hypothetical protein
MMRSLYIFLFGLIASLWAQPAPETSSVVNPPIPPSPVEDFRRWLTMAEADREKELAGYPEEKQTVLRRKIAIYQAMRPADRDVRLQLLELRWYLQPLMSTAATNRGNYLGMIPVHLHESIRARLRHWDNLTESTRKEILADQKKREMALRYYVLPRRTVIAPPPFPTDQAPVPPDLREHFRRWEGKSPSARAKISTHLATFFQMPREEQLEALNQFSEEDRKEMQKTLDAFGRLTPEARRACVNSFQKFATMSREERTSFLRNATRWQQLSAEDRAAWRELVEKVPPLPPVPLPTAPMPQAPSTEANSSKFTGTNKTGTP